MDHFRATEGDVNFTPARAAWQDENLDDESRALLMRDAGVFLHQSMSSPCVDALAGCEGPYVVNNRGQRILDFHGNNVHQVGFSNPDVVRAMKEQLDGLSFSTRRFTNEKAVTFAEKLVELTGGALSRVLFAPGATSAIGMALKLARIATGRHKTVSLWDSFHGASLDAISVGGEAVFRSGIGPLLPGSEHVLPYNSYRCPLGECTGCGLKCVKYLEYVLARETDVGAVILETVRNTDVQVPPAEYYKEVRRLCDKTGALLILDETAVCMGRTGKWFAYQNYDIVPDMVVCGKGLGGGVMPLAALLAREELNVAGHVSLGHYTHEKSPVACAAGLAAVTYIEREGLLQRTIEDGAYFRALLNRIMERHDCVGDVRGIGLLNAVELVTDRRTREPDAALAERVMYGCLADGLSFKVSQGNVLSLYPALVATREQLSEAARIIERWICTAGDAKCDRLTVGPNSRTDRQEQGGGKAMLDHGKRT